MNAYRWRLITGAGALFILLLCIRLIAPHFPYGVHAAPGVTFVFVGFMIAAGGVYMALFQTLTNARDPANPRRHEILFILLIGLVLRLLFFGSNTILEDDWRRYLWDGAVVSTGVNPYLFTPANVISDGGIGAETHLTDDYNTVKAEAVNDPAFLKTINYPYVATIYPPVAQAGFALAHFLAPYNLDAWRLVLLFADLCAFGLLIGLLRARGANEMLSALYWWNPLIVFTIYNGAHMDAILAPFLLGFMWLMHAQRRGVAAIVLAGAVGVKLWPALLAPFLMRFSRRHSAANIRTGLIFTLCTVLIMAPMLIAVFTRNNSGLIAYAETWQVNAAFFSVYASVFSVFGDSGGAVARPLLAIGVTGVSVYLAWRASGNRLTTEGAVFIATATLFLSSPTGYPWYFLWVAVLLPLAPSMPIGVLTMTLPLYYLRYFLNLHGLSLVFNGVIVPIEFLAPVAVYALQKRMAAHARS